MSEKRGIGNVGKKRDRGTSEKRGIGERRKKEGLGNVLKKRDREWNV